MIHSHIKMNPEYIDHQHYATHNGIKYMQIKDTEHSNKNFIVTRDSWYQNISIPKHKAFCDAHNTQNWAQPTPRPEYRCSWWFWHREQNSFLLGASSKLLRGWVWLESFNILQNWERITTLSIRYWLQSIWGKHFWFQCFFNIKYWFQSPWCYFSILICLLGLKSKPKINIKINIFPMFPLVSPFPFGPQTLQHQPPPLEGCMHKFHGKVLSFAKDQDPFSRISSITPFFKGCPFSRDALSQGPLATYPFARVLSFCKDQCWYLSLSQGMSKELQG